MSKNFEIFIILLPVPNPNKHGMKITNIIFIFDQIHPSRQIEGGKEQNLKLLFSIILISKQD